MPNHPLLHSLVQVARRLDSGIPHVFPHQSGTRKDEKAFAQRCCYHVPTLESFVRCCSKDWSTSVLNTCQSFGSNCCFLLSSFKSLCSLSKRPNQSTSLLLSRCQSCSSFQLINVYTKGPLIVFASITLCLLQHGPSSLLGWHNLPDPPTGGCPVTLSAHAATPVQGDDVRSCHAPWAWFTSLRTCMMHWTFGSLNTQLINFPLNGSVLPHPAYC